MEIIKEEENDNGTRKIFEGIMIKNFPKFTVRHKPQIQESRHTKQDK